MPHTKQEKPFSEKLKAFFRVGKSSGFAHPGSYELELSSEVVEELSAPQSISTRLKVLKELGSQVREQRLQKHGVELLWYKVHDMLEPGQEKETRHTVLDFLVQLVVGQYNSMDMMRPQLFGFIREHKVREDMEKRVSVLGALTENGKDIVHIEEKVGPFLLELLEIVTAEDCGGDVLGQLLSFTSNMVKFNSAYLSQGVVVRLIVRLSLLSCSSTSDKEILQCLDILKCVVMYSYVPPEALVPFISCVCRVVNLSNVSTDAWDTMRKLMGTHLGHSALYQLCQIIQSPENREETALVRGAVFFIGHSLWGAQRIPSLKYSPMTVLPVFCTALDTSHQLVLYEVVVQVERLVTKHQETITAPSWEEAVSVLELLVTRLSILEEDKMQLVYDHLQATIGQLEQLAMTDSYAGSRSRLYSLVESVSDISPEASVVHLVNYQHSTYLHPAREGWLDKMATLVDRLYCQEHRQVIRLAVLGVLREVVTSNMVLHEEQLMERCVLPFLSSVDGEVDRVVRVQAVKTIALFASKATGSHLLDLVEILEKIVRKFGESPPNIDTAVLYTKQDFDYHLEAVRGLIQCMKVKFTLGPGPVARRCYYALVTVLDSVYERPAVLEHTGEVRLEIFHTLLNIRANRDYHLGFPRVCGRGEDYSFSPLLVCENKDEGKMEGVTVMSLTRACLCVLKCLREEKDWTVLGLVLEKVPSTLQNKGMLTRYGKNISMFASVLCSLFAPSHPLPTINIPTKFGRPEFQSAVYPVLAALASYNRSLEQDLQKKLIKCFEYGLLTSKCNQVCIVALTACILEMSGSMYTLLPEVLLNLSKISATVHIAIPVLEFLSTLISLPKVFASFNTEQFLSVFAITLPYTNPFKFNHYTVSLAHHVIIMWFLKCRLVNRKDFVKFIIKGLGSNVLQPFEEGNFRKVESGTSLASLNQDSSNRQRSSSLKEETTSRRVRHNTGVPSRPTLNRLSGPDERQALLTFHQELTETCVDLMARYSFANCGVSPKRGAVSQYLLSQGQSNSWLLGNVIITITVSGCVQSGNRGGFCDSCYAYCSQEGKGADSEAGEGEEGGKKRHQSEQSQRVRREKVGGEVEIVQPLVRDDSHVNQLKEIRKENGGRRRGQLPDIPQSVGGCGCWCQGWCEVLVRRPSGVTSWVARVQNGLLSNQPSQETDMTLADITDLLRPDLVGSDGGKSRSSVQRSNSSPSIGEEGVSGGTRLELDLAGGGRRTRCGTIAETEEEGGDLSPAPVPRTRAATISTSPTKLPRSAPLPPAPSDRGGGAAISPQFLFLQLYQAAGLPTSYTEKPRLLPSTKSIESSLKNLDRIFCYETHKVGVLYVGPGQQCDERAILSNQFGSSRYSVFLSGLGTLLDITTTDPSQVFLGGLDPRDDGQFHYVWQDDAMQVVYHAATLMPTNESDLQFNKKKRHIGNDYVAIVYNDSGDQYTMGTVKGQFIYAHIIVEPLDFGSNRISVVCKPELEGELGHLSTSRIVSDPNLSRLVRQIALHCNLAAIIFSKSKMTKDPYASNWLERLRHIKRFKGKVLKEQEEEETSGQIHDFTGYV